MDRIRSMFSGGSADADAPAATLKTKNFPPFYPLMHHSLAECGRKKFLAILGMINYAAFVFLIVTNFLGCAILFFAGITIKSWITSTLGSLVLSFVWLLALPLVVFFTGYLVTYKACSSSFIVHYIVFFVSFTLLVIFSIVMAIGLPNTGGCGLFAGILAAVNGGSSGALYFSMIWCFVQCALWAAIAILQFIMIAWMSYFFVTDASQGKGGSVKGRIVKGMIRNAI